MTHFLLFFHYIYAEYFLAWLPCLPSLPPPMFVFPTISFINEEGELSIFITMTFLGKIFVPEWSTFFFASTVITLFLGKHFTPFYSHVSDTSCVWTLWFCMCGVNFFHPKLDYFIIGLVILCEEGLLLEANLPVVWMFLRNIFLRGTLRSDDCSVWEVLSLRFVWCVMCVWIVRDMDLSESAKCRLFECAMWYSEE